MSMCDMRSLVKCDPFHGPISNEESPFTRIVLITGVGYLSTLLLIYFMVSEDVPEPYMDEIFHVQQARAYFVGNFTQWNPKITTPPGLYLTTLGVLKPFSELYAFGEEDSVKICPTLLLRFINILFALANPYVMYCILIKDQPQKVRINCLLSSLSLATLPPLFFFNFLYYTDAGSLFFVLIMYYYHYNNQEWLASLFGIISLLYRQTNIVWVFFLAAHTSFNIFLRNWDKMKKKSSPIDRLKALIITTVPQVLLICGGYVIVGMMFLIFLIYNRGIVLGDRDAHTSVFHFNQILYFAFFTTVFGFPWIATRDNLMQFFGAICRNKFKFAIIVTFIAASLYFCCHAHPYLLADNRHFTFYVWRKFLGCPTKLSSRQILCSPLYAFALYTILSMLKSKDALWKYLFSICLCISIVPQKLLEFRYFIVPFTIWRLNIPNSNHVQLTLEFILNCFLNILTIYIFLYKTFKWPQNVETQRFMW